MARLLANCAAALRLKPELAGRTKRFLAEIDPEKARHFEILMTNERASQYLAEATLGDMNVITANNVEEIYEEIQRRAAEKVAVEKDNEYRGQIAALETAVRESEESTEKLRTTLLETQLEADARRMQIHELTQQTSELKAEHVSSLSRIEQQDLQLEALRASAARANETAGQVQDQLNQQWERGRRIAARFADRRTRLLRGVGVLLFFGLAFGIGYFDRFVLPRVEAEGQSQLNLAVVLLQALLAISGVSLLVDPLVKRPIERLKRYLYQQRLAELGISEDQVAEVKSE